MTSIYSDLSDEDLQAKIAMLREAYEKVALGGVAVVVQGEGRRVEYSKANSAGLADLLKIAQREKLSREGVQVTGALRTTFPYGGDRFNG